MHLFPSLVRPDLVQEPAPAPVVEGFTLSGFGTGSFAGAEIGLPLEVEQIAPNGVFLGDPRLCSAETGAALLDRLVTIGAQLAAHVARTRAA